MTPHFSYGEATTTKTGAVNTPPPRVAMRMGVTAMRLEAVRELLDKPIIVTSWYRSPKVNWLVGGSENSAHIAGDAVDFKCPAYGANYDVACVIRDAARTDTRLAFDQLILEYGWIHISFADGMRGECLTKKSEDAPYVRGLVK